MGKEQFINRLKEAYNNPGYFFKDGKVNAEKLQEFFQEFVDVYLQPSMQEITQKRPTVVFQDFEKGSTKVENPTGKYERDDATKQDKIIMSVKRFASCKSEAEFKNTLLEVMGIVCHEYHHFKQAIYGDMLESGNTQKAEAVHEQMTIKKEDFEHATSIGAFKYDQLELIEKTMPGTMLAMNLVGNQANKVHGSVVRSALYFRNPLERDARDASLVVYNDIAREIGAESGDKKLASHMKKVGRRQGLKNFIDNHRQPKAVVSLFENATKKIKPEHIIEYGKLIDKEMANPNKTPEQEARLKHLQETYVENLKAIKLMLGEEGFKNFMEQVEKSAPEGSFASKTLDAGADKSQGPTTEKVSMRAVAEERGKETEQEQIVIQKRQERELDRELTIEEEQALAAQMSKRIDD